MKLLKGIAVGYIIGFLIALVLVVVIADTRSMTFMESFTVRNFWVTGQFFAVPCAIITLVIQFFYQTLATRNYLANREKSIYKSNSVIKYRQELDNLATEAHK